MTAQDFVVSKGSLVHTINLRSDVLGWERLTIPLDRDSRSVHFFAKSAAGDVIGCGSCGPSAFPAPDFAAEPAVRFYGVAVTPEFQSLGVGGQILSAIIAEVTQRRATILWANARESALPFYLSRGFQTVGETFTDLLSGLTDSRILIRLPEKI